MNRNRNHTDQMTLGTSVGGEAMERPSVLLIGSNNLLWDSIRTALEAMHTVCVADDIVDARLAVERACACRPDAMIVELADTDSDAPVLSLVADLRSRCPESRILALAACFESSRFLALAGLGVQGFILWRDLDLATLRHCLDAVLGGQLVVASKSLPTELLHAESSASRAEAAAVALTEREQAVLRGLASGRTQKEIAAADHLSLRTIKRIVAGLEAKLNAPSPFVLGARARALGLI